MSTSRPILGQQLLASVFDVSGDCVIGMAVGGNAIHLLQPFGLALVLAPLTCLERLDRQSRCTPFGVTTLESHGRKSAFA